MGSNVGNICGIGINDANYSVKIDRKVDGRKKTVWQCPIYRTWKNVILRGYCPRFKERYPTYRETTVYEEWHRFSNFKAWMETQDWEGKLLDKDLLVEGNKIYSPDTCVFISQSLNTFLTYTQCSNSSGYVGVSKSRNKWKSSICNPFSAEREYLGYFDSPQDAHEAWRKRKHELALIYAEQETDERIKQALRIRFK